MQFTESCECFVHFKNIILLLQPGVSVCKLCLAYEPFDPSKRLTIHKRCCTSSQQTDFERVPDRGGFQGNQ